MCVCVYVKLWQVNRMFTLLVISRYFRIVGAYHHRGFIVCRENNGDLHTSSDTAAYSNT